MLQYPVRIRQPTFGIDATAQRWHRNFVDDMVEERRFGDDLRVQKR
jgi:hypothetical protein